MPSEKLKRLSYNPYEKMSNFVIALRTLVESIPFGLGPYGIGDAISFYEGFKGKMIFGPQLDKIDRIISFIAAFIPLVPATPFRIAVSKIRDRLSFI